MEITIFHSIMSDGSLAPEILIEDGHAGIYLSPKTDDDADALVKALVNHTNDFADVTDKRRDV